MTTLQKTSHADYVRQSRTSKKPSGRTPQKMKQTTRRTYHSASVYLPVEPRPVVRQTPGNAIKKSRRKGSDIAFSLGRAAVRAPALNIPQLGPRWVSAALTLLISCLLYTIWTASPFMVTEAQVLGNQRLGAADINAMLGIIGQPIFKAIPAQIEANLQTAYSDLQSVKVHVDLPNRIIVNVVERKPVLAWYQNGVVTWIDASGVAFMPRGEAQGLVQVAANSTPTSVIGTTAPPLDEQKYIAPEMVQALTVLAGDVPAGMPMIFDLHYGMGWQDPRGWTVYFGQDAKDIPMKKMVYQTIVDTLTLQGVQPSLISVAFLDAPFYK